MREPSLKSAYTVIVNAPNPDKKLMPGMTASITIFMAEAREVITIPVKALKFKPELPDSITRPANLPQLSGQQVWVYDGKQMHPRQVITGLSDGSHVEVKSGLKAGDEVVLATRQAESSNQEEKTVSSPFVPKRPGSSKNNKPPQP